MKTRFRVNANVFIPLLMAALISVAVPVAFAQKKKGGTKKSTKPKTEKQDKTTLETKKQNLQAEIDLTNKLLAETRRNKTLSLSQLVALNKKIEVRQQLISTIQGEINDLNNQIADKQEAIALLDSEIVKLKANYAHMVVYAYRNRNAYQNMLFVFSAENFNQAYKRLKYLQLISQSRRLQSEKITSRQQELNEEKSSLEADRSEKKKLLGIEEEETGQLTKEKEEKDQTVKSLQSKEQQLKDDLAKKKAQKAATDAAIQKLLEEEAARAAAAAAAPKPGTTKPAGDAKPKTTPGAKPGDKPAAGAPPKIELTPEAQSLGNSFEVNQGKLPWPVEKGTITSHFGKHPHPVLKDVTTQNNGIDISTNSGSQARAVFEGEVTGLTNIPGSGWLVIIRHGIYLTVYSNLEEVNVKQGDKVKTKQVIGKVATDQSEGTTEIHFEVWKSGVGKMDPEAWLLKSNR